MIRAKKLVLAGVKELVDFPHMALTENIQTQYESEGYFVAKRVFTGSQLQTLQSEYDRIVSTLLSSGEAINARWNGAEVDKLGAADTVVFHTHNVQQYSAAWTQALVSEAFIGAVQPLLGPNIVLHHTKLFQKPAENGAPFPMHQDWEYFPTRLNTMMAGIIHLSDANDEMGCLRVFPGSHKLGRLSSAMGGARLEDYPIEKATPLEAEAGDVVFFNYCLIHGSMPNRSDRVRKTVLVQLLRGDDEVDEGNLHPNARLCISGWNSAAKRSTANQS